MNTAYYTCPLCDFENTILFEHEAFDVQEITVENDDSGMECVGCRREMDADAIYEAAQMAVAEGV